MGFHQVEEDPRDRVKTAFLTHRGLYVYNVMPFGFCNAPATIQRLMERVLGTIIDLGVRVYIDDVMIYAKTPEQLIEILSTVLKPFAQVGLKCKASKCSFLHNQLTTSAMPSRATASTLTPPCSIRSSSGLDLKMEQDLRFFMASALLKRPYTLFRVHQRPPLQGFKIGYNRMDRVSRGNV